MAIYHLHQSHGSRKGGQSGGAKFDYITHEGKYSKKHDHCRCFSSRLPSEYGGATPTTEQQRSFWLDADKHERANATLFTQIEFALPVELTNDGQQQAVLEFIEANIPNQPYTFAIHEGKGHNPHVHLIYSDRMLDGKEREQGIFFKKADKRTAEERRGAEKNRNFKGGKDHRRELLVGRRESWATIANKALDNEASLWRKIQKSIPQIDHRTLEAQGINREPQIHRGPARQGRINRQYEEVINGMGRSNSGEADQVVTRRPRKLNRTEIERRALQDIERNKRIKKTNRSPRKREQESFEHSVNNELRMEEASWDIEWSTGRSSEILEERLQQIGRSLEERGRIHKDNERKLKSDGGALRKRLQNKLGASQRLAKSSLQTVPRRADRPRPAHQFALRDFELPARKIKPSYERERRKNPRVGQCTKRVNRTIQQRFNRLGREIKRRFEQISGAVERRAAIAAKSLERHTTIFTDLAKSVGNKIPILTKTKKRKMPEYKTYSTSHYFVDSQRIERRKRARIHSSPPGYTCPFQAQKRIEQRRKQQEMSQDKPKSKFASVRIERSKKIDRGNDKGISMGR